MGEVFAGVAVTFSDALGPSRGATGNILTLGNSLSARRSFMVIKSDRWKGE